MMSSSPDPRNAANGALERAATELATAMRGKVSVNQRLARYTSIRVGGPAAILVEPEDDADLERMGTVISGLGIETLVLGRGTNVLIADGGFPGVVIRIGRGFEWIRGIGRSEVEAGGGLPLPVVANWAAKRSLTGMEFAVAIPATVGGAVRMNAGAHGSSLSEVLRTARVYRLNAGLAEELTVDGLGMSYRQTVLGPADVVCSARFQLSPGSKEEISARMEHHRKHRSTTQPSDAPNAGSMFKNPEGRSAGALIEQAGMKGHRVGGAEVSLKHANFFLAHAGATAQDVYDLMAHVQSEVLARFEVLLIPEVRIIGAFDTTAGLITAA
jgi:UDP-N-acetylmuramate dehydrogenase